MKKMPGASTQFVAAATTTERVGQPCSLPATARESMVRQRLRKALVSMLCFAAWTSAQAGYSNLFLFGDSLSDTGNNAFVFDAVGVPLPPGTLRTPVPTLDNSFIATYPYAYPTPLEGRYSNGPVWAETFASALGLSAIASNLGGTNYAYGGARVAPLGSLNPFFDFPNNFPLSLTTQVATFLSAYPQAPADGLYIVAGGGNDARDIIAAAGQDLANNVDPTAGILARAAAYAASVDAIVNQLGAAGARDIIVWNTPNAGLAPAVLAQGAGLLGQTISEMINGILMLELADEVAMGVRIFDTYGFITGVASDPAAFGLVDGVNACAATANRSACQQAAYQYLFWDGIHPTTAAHSLLADAMIAFVPEPGSLVLCAVGLFGLAAGRKRKLQ